MIMKNFLPALFFFVSILGHAQSHDVVSTTYKDGIFRSECRSVIDTDRKTADNVVADLVNEFHEKPDNLFNWALSGLGLQGEGNNIIIIVLKSSTFDKPTGITHGLIDIVVPGFHTFKDVALDGKFSLKTKSAAETVAYGEILTQNAVVNQANGSFSVFPVANNSNKQLVCSKIEIKFGWFFNIFITQKRYKAIVDWRLVQFNKNIASE